MCAERRGKKALGEPYDGKRQVRFDEGVLETGHIAPERRVRPLRFLRWVPRQYPTLQMRNVSEHLSRTQAAEARRRMRVAYGMKESEKAEEVLRNTVRWLGQISESAAASLQEGMEETLTVVRLGLPDSLRRTFATTNPLESAFDGVRYRTGRVKRWRKGKGQMVLRWTAAAALETQKRFHRIKGHRLLPLLIEKLNQIQMDEKKEVG